MIKLRDSKSLIALALMLTLMLASSMVAAQEEKDPLEDKGSFAKFYNPDGTIKYHYKTDPKTGRMKDQHFCPRLCRERLEGHRPSSVTLEDCEAKMRGLNNLSEVIDRTGDCASDKIQMWFVNALNAAKICAEQLSGQTGDKHTVSKDLFGSSYTLKH